jgi:hypothetical protein
MEKLHAYQKDLRDKSDGNQVLYSGFKKTRVYAKSELQECDLGLELQQWNQYYMYFPTV